MGGAAHIDFWDGNYRNRFRPEGRTAAGIDGLLGLDYTFNCAPINLRLDWQASFTFIGTNFTNADWLGVAIRFAF